MPQKIINNNKTIDITPYVQYFDLDFIVKNVYNGLHSQFPYCCIVWHTFVHAPHYIWLTRYMPFLFNMNNKKRKAKDKVGYVRCPICLTLDYKVDDYHICGPECPTMRPIKKIPEIESLRFRIFESSRKKTK